MQDNIKTIRNHQSSEGNCESSTLEGPIDGLSILYVTDQPKLGLQKYNTKSFVSPENLIPRREECESNPNGAQSEAGRIRFVPFRSKTLESPPIERIKFETERI